MIASKRNATPKGIRQSQKIYAFIIHYATWYDGLTPTMREIEGHCGFATNSAPAMHVQRLRNAGALVMLAGGRRYRVAGARWAGPAIGLRAQWPHAPGAYDVLAYMIQYKQTTAGISPTVREIAAHLSLNSSSIVHDAWQLLIGVGWLIPAGRMTGYLVKGGKWTPPPAATIAKYSGKVV